MKKFSALMMMVSLFATACGQPPPDKDGPGIVINNDNNGDLDAGTAVDGGNGADGGTEVDLGGSVTDPDGPEIIEFSVAPERVTEGQTAQVTAIISDPQGFADIGGGRVLDENGDVVGLFEGSGGSYSFPLSWDAMHNVAPITFAAEQQRIFTAEFFDAAGNRGRQAFAVTLHCNGDPACDGACAFEECGGECKDIEEYQSDTENCGGCGNVCAFCQDAECLDCKPLDPPAPGVCDPLCQTGCSAGETCTFDMSAQTVCQAPGPGSRNEACTPESDCEAGLICIIVQQEPIEGRCWAFCDLNTGECGSGACQSIQGLPSGLGVCVEGL